MISQVESLSGEGKNLIQEVQERYIEMLSWLEELKTRPDHQLPLLETILEDLSECQTKQSQLVDYLRQLRLQWNGGGGKT